MWPFTGYPERTAQDVAGKSYDYIIVGGGTAGCLIANRLSSNNSASVLVLDKGRVNAGPLARVPLLGILQSGVVNRYSEPNAHLRDRRVRLAAAEMLGGTSRVNSMVWVRGRREEYDGWARDLGLNEWGWEKVEGAFRVVQSDGDGGIQRQLGPEIGFLPYVDAMMNRLGLGVRDPEDESAGAQGYSRTELTVGRDGRRSSALTAWLDADVANARREHLTVCTGVVATKLEFGDGGSRVSGVRIRPVGRGADADVLVTARREVIVCSGVFGTPQLLMLSGVGPGAQLSEHSIPVVHDLPAVGSHLSTHMLVPVMTELPRKHTLHVVETIAILWHVLLYLFLGSGLLASSGQPGAAFLHSSALDDKTLELQPAKDEKEVADLEVLVTSVSTLIEHGIPGVPCLTWNAALVQPFGTGHMELLSGTNPEAQPRITLPLLADERDRVRLRKAVRFAMRLADEFASPETGYPHPAPLALAPGVDLEWLDAVMDKTKTKSQRRKIQRAVPPQRDAWRTVADAEIDKYVARLVTGSYNPSGTCRMSLTKENGVVDQRLRVHGVKNLRIADGSVLPRTGRASISSAIYMIGERCAEFVRDQWQEDM